tara:strand:+ start:791 stop:1711 length:921 start_codon:yes stop_codon:yes gene_type:complete
MATPKLVPRANGEGGLGAAALGWGPVFVTDTTTSSATTGGKLTLTANDGAAMDNNHRLGVVEFNGATDASNSLGKGARIQAICRDAWDGSNNDADLEFYTTNGTNPNQNVLTLNADMEAVFSTKALISAAGVTAVNKRTLWVPIANMVPAGTNGADEESVEYHATDAGTLKKLKYDKTTTEFADFSLVMPEQWDGGTMKVKFYWSSATSGGGTVWRIKSRGIGDGESFTGWGTPVTSTDTSTGANALNISPATAAMTVANRSDNTALLFFRIERVVGDASDDHNDDTRLIGVNIEYTEQIEAHTAF